MLVKQREVLENQDSLMARLLSAEEAIKAKDEENKELQDKMKQMKSDLETIPVLRAQVREFVNKAGWCFKSTELKRGNLVSQILTATFLNP